MRGRLIRWQPQFTFGIWATPWMNKQIGINIMNHQEPCRRGRKDRVRLEASAAAVPDWEAQQVSKGWDEPEPQIQRYDQYIK